MKKKHLSDTHPSPAKKPSGSHFVKLVPSAALIAGVLAISPSFSQKLPQTMNHATKGMVEVIDKKETSEHQHIVRMPLKDILTQNGPEKGMEIIRDHLLAQINIKRHELGNAPLNLHPVLNDIAQSKAQDMADNGYFDHTDMHGDSDAKRMIKDGRYDFQKFMSNISYNIKTIAEVVQSYKDNDKWKTGHYDIISVQDYADLGVGFALGKNGICYVVVNSGKELYR